MILSRNLLFFCFYVEVFTFKWKNNYDHRTPEALIFEQCMTDHDTLIINDNNQLLNSTWLQKLYEQFHSVILHNKKCRYLKKNFNVKKIANVLIILSSEGPSPSSELNKILKSRYQTTWWNVMAPVFILYLPKNNCNIVLDIFTIMWTYMILTSYFLCVEFNEIQIYTYNPFASRAPGNWTEVSLSTPTKTHWTMYEQQYRPETICQGLDFDRTEHLDGYPITVVAPIADETNRSFEGQLIEYNDLLRYGKITETRCHFIIDALAMKLNIRPHLFVSKKMYYDEMRDLTYTKHVMKVSRAVRAKLVLTDYYLSMKMTFGNRGFIRLYPLAWYENGIATYNRGYQTLAERFGNFYGFWTILFTMLVLLITFIVIWYTESKKTSFAMFEIIRLLISNGLYTRMNTLPLRIFFISVLIYFLIIQATFNGHLAEFLTKPKLRTHPETMEDLRDFGYTIYDTNYVKEHLAKTNEEKVKYKALIKSCLNHILYNDSSVACIFNYHKLVKQSQSQLIQHFYISKRSSESLYLTLLIRNHWPLFNRMNMMIMSLEELGFRQFISDQWEHNLTHNFIVAQARSRKDFQPITLENLIFVFPMLAIGLISATLSFCIEMCISYRSKWKVISHTKNHDRKIFKIVNRINVLPH